MKADISEAQVTIFLEINGYVHAVALEKDKFDAITLLIKVATKHAIKTKRTQSELVEFIDIGGIA